VECTPKLRHGNKGQFSEGESNVHRQTTDFFYDNAKAESFMKTLKQEEVDGRDYRDLQHAREAIGVFIEEAYN